MGDTIAQTRVLTLEKTKTTQALEIDSLKRRVKKLEKKQRSKTHKLKRLYKVGLTARVDSSEDEPSLGEDTNKQGRKIDDIDVDEDITIVNAQDDAKMFDDKGKGIMVEEPVKPKKNDQVRLDEEVTLKLQAKFDEEEQRLARERKKLKYLKNKSFDSIQKMFNKVFKRVNTFEPISSELVEGSSKRAGEEIEQERSKKQKVDDDKEITKLKKLMEIIPNEEEVANDVTPLAVKSSKIVDWKIHKEGKKNYY
nr:hypothetical protein [Tanacetum cinerariifolium]